jgi:hypothetical protein
MNWPHPATAVCANPSSSSLPSSAWRWWLICANTRSHSRRLARQRPPLCQVPRQSPLGRRLVASGALLMFTGPSALVRWLIIGGTGLFIVVTAVFVELQRERLVARAQAWREALAAWD